MQIDDAMASLNSFALSCLLLLLMLLLKPLLAKLPVIAQDLALSA